MIGQLHVPAIYRFPEPVPQWGFQSLHELLIAANNRFAVRQQPVQTKRQFFRNFFGRSQSKAGVVKVKRAEYRTRLDIVWEGDHLPSVVDEKEVNNNDYLSLGMYVPAGWGMNVLAAIDAGAYSVKWVSMKLVPAGDDCLVEVFLDHEGKEVPKGK